MERIIKFRAWDKKENKMLNIGNPFDSHYTTDDDGVHYGELVTFGLSYDKDRYIIEQYTGLKDKKGKEIYEGDICLFDGKYKYPVRFDEGCFCTDAWSDFDPLFRCKDIEIIGNIHEEPNKC